jgi:RNA polymerase sigma-70 factor (ECF subfamily)
VTTRPEDAAELGELGDHVHGSIQKLSPKLRAVLVLRHLEHQNYDELCATLGLSMGTVKSRMARAHVALQRELAGTLEPFGYQADTDGNYSSGSDHGQEGVA